MELCLAHVLTWVCVCVCRVRARCVCMCVCCVCVPCVQESMKCILIVCTRPLHQAKHQPNFGKASPAYFSVLSMLTTEYLHVTLMTREDTEALICAELDVTTVHTPAVVILRV